ncbi:thiazole synthase [Vibrio pectenicida]|uniref:Thiazole synthase n=1 Tax=Vibrio pectenicida TaxID=62763 RepID=A0A7Y4EFP8_9VIBR|nr:thiazole synthase [Vibrio pectenicida]NOH72802.1 thiazole synthase [Vibrio pectenicida]
MLTIGDKRFESRLISGTGKFSNSKLMVEAIEASGSELATMALKRVNLNDKQDNIVQPLLGAGVNLLPNTSGAKNAKDAIFAANLAREALETNWIKLEIHPDPKYLLPDPIETLVAADELVRQGFIVLPYCHADPVLCKRLEEVGCSAVMPLGSPIGSNRGMVTKDFLNIIIDQANVPVVVDAGIGAPSHAALAMEMGADAVIVNTAIASSRNPIAMATAFKMAVEAGRIGYKAGLASKAYRAVSSSPLTSFLDEL